MFDAPLRNMKDRLAEPIAERLVSVSPNVLSLVALAVGIGAAGLAVQEFYGWALLLWLINRMLDGLDGLIARLHDKQSDFGGYLDIMVDFVVYAIVPIGLVFGAPTADRYLALALMLASFYINAASWMYLAAVLEKRGARDLQATTTIVMPAGLIGGTETIIAYCAFLIFPARMTLLFSLFTVLVLVTIIQRLIWARHSLR